MLRTQEHGLFTQDDFKVNSRITINAGLRYEISAPRPKRTTRS